MNHVPNALDHWLRQCGKARLTKVYEVVQLPRSPEDRPLIIAMTSKTSAQKLIAAFAESEGPERYRCTCFEHPEFNFDR